jgi:hypothetical protein
MNEEARRKAKRRDYIDRGLAERNRRRDEYYARREQQRSRCVECRKG